MKLWQFLLGLVLGALILAMPPSQWQRSPLSPLQDITVQLDGRKKPLDTVAREEVAQIHGRANYTAANGERLGYLDTYLSLWFNTRDWNQEPFILLSYKPLKERLDFEVERKYFTFEELATSDLSEIVREAERKSADGIDLSRDEREATTVGQRLEAMLGIVGSTALPLVPHPDDIKGTWLGLERATDDYEAEQVAPILADFQMLRQTYRDTPEHLMALGPLAANFQEKLAELSPQVYPDEAVMAREVRFAQLHPFGKAWKLYAIAFCLVLAAFTLPGFDCYGSSLGIFAAGLAMHGYGFFERMQIAGRPPVTNMYESVVWVSFGIAAVALLFELTSKARYYLLAAAPLAAVCLVLADSLPAVLDPSISPLVPVLRDNFWLSVHVPTITLSYASFALALGLGHLILGNYLLAPQATERIRSLSQLNYRVLQVGVLLLTTGIILGGVWAHYSWGRFWGWDPKETWALIALLCYIVPLHGRLVGWLGDFGMSVTSVVCFNAVLMAWYGVNFVLGTGLHSYGFGTGGSELAIAACVGLDLLFVGAAAWRQRSRSMAAATAAIIQERSEAESSEAESVVAKV
ncbi:MAG: cytochrome c biogenesis protein CcsA [Cyanobacteria bacterium J06641_5]